MSVQVLNDIEARAGASDKDVELWKAQRALGVTATNIRDVMIAGNRDQAIRDLVDKKINGDPFKGNAYTAWGTEREPIIVAELAGVGVVAESRVFHAEANSRFLASPDGLIVTFDDELLLEEIKTSGKPLPKGSPLLAEKGYEWQMQWQCLVMGAQGCWLTVELREGRPGSFRPGVRSREFFPRDESMIAQMIPVAEQILTAMDDPAAAPALDEDVDTHAVNYLRFLADEKAAGEAKKAAYAALIAAGVSQESPLARVTFTPAVPAVEVEDVVIDLEAAEKALPELTDQLEDAKERVEQLQAEWDAMANRYTKTVKTVSKGSAARVTVTAGKATKEAK